MLSPYKKGLAGAAEGAKHLVRDDENESDELELLGGQKLHIPGYTQTEVALDILSLLFAEVQHMGALTAIYCHSEEKGLGMSLASTYKFTLLHTSV